MNSFKNEDKITFKNYQIYNWLRNLIYFKNQKFLFNNGNKVYVYDIDQHIFELFKLET